MTDSRIDTGDYGEMASVDYEVETTDYENPYENAYKDPYSDSSSSYNSSDSIVSDIEPHDNIRGSEKTNQSTKIPTLLFMLTKWQVNSLIPF